MKKNIVVTSILILLLAKSASADLIPSGPIEIITSKVGLRGVYDIIKIILPVIIIIFVILFITRKIENKIQEKKNKNNII